MRIVGTLTLVFGALVVYSITGGDLSTVLSSANLWGVAVIIGAVLALIAYILFGEIMLLTASKKMTRMVEQMQQQQQQELHQQTENPAPSPPKEFLGVQARIRIASTAELVILFAILATMVSPRFL